MKTSDSQPELPQSGANSDARRRRAPEPLKTTGEPIIAVRPLAVDKATAARLLGMSTSMLDGYVRAKKLFPKFVNTKPVFPMTELERFLNGLPDEPEIQIVA